MCSNHCQMVQANFLLYFTTAERFIAASYLVTGKTMAVTSNLTSDRQEKACHWYRNTSDGLVECLSLVFSAEGGMCLKNI